MTSHFVFECELGAETFVDTPDTSVAISQMEKMYDGMLKAYLLYKSHETDSEPTHIMVDDATYALVDLGKLARLEGEIKRLTQEKYRALDQLSGIGIHTTMDNDLNDRLRVLIILYLQNQ
jgi:hypothetical protein